MSQFQFKLESLLKYRILRRDECRRLMGEIMQHDAELVADQQRLTADRGMQLEEMRHLGTSGAVNIDASAARRFYAGQLTGSIKEIDRRREMVAEQLNLCRQALVKADQDVKALEKLKEKQELEFRQAWEKRQQYELEESWSATHFSEGRT